MNDTLLALVSPLLQTRFHIRPYQDLLKKHSQFGIFNNSRLGGDYWDVLPIYVVSRCPFCFDPYYSPLDTHSLHTGWTTSADEWTSTQFERDRHIGCAHFTAIQCFVNLNGHIPGTGVSFRNELDVPFIMPIFVPDDIPSIAVIHSLPICRIEKGAFIPRYLALFITYYSRDSKKLWDRRTEELEKEGFGDLEYRGSKLYSAAHVRNQPESYNLGLWLLNRKLAWIDMKSMTLSLRLDKEGFPYNNIQGYRRIVDVDNGTITNLYDG